MRPRNWFFLTLVVVFLMTIPIVFPGNRQRAEMQLREAATVNSQPPILQVDVIPAEKANGALGKVISVCVSKSAIIFSPNENWNVNWTPGDPILRMEKVSFSFQGAEALVRNIVRSLVKDLRDFAFDPTEIMAGSLDIGYKDRVLWGIKLYPLTALEIKSLDGGFKTFFVTLSDDCLANEN